MSNSVPYPGAAIARARNRQAHHLTVSI
jgi:hypothetical protein